MTMTEPWTSVPWREVTDRTGRTYRIGERDTDLLDGRTRTWMTVLPWLATTATGAATLAFATAERHRLGGALLPLLAIWTASQATVALPTGHLRETGQVPARTAVALGATAILLSWPFLAYFPNPAAARTLFALLSGAGTALIWTSCVHTTIKWHPDRKGSGTGLVAGGLALGATPFVFLSRELSAYRPELVAAGALLCVAVAAAGRPLRDPPRNWWPPHLDPRGATTHRTRAPAPFKGRGELRDQPPHTRTNPPAARHLTPRQSRRTPQLWLTWTLLLLTGTTAVFTFAAQVHLHTTPGCTALAFSAGAYVGGHLSDRHTPRTTLATANAVLAFALLATAATPNSTAMLIHGTTAGLAAGATLPLTAALTADFFGENHNAVHHGTVLTSGILSAPVGCFLGASVVRGTDHGGAYLLAGSIGLVCAVLALLLRAPGRPRVRDILPNPHPLGEEMA
ncbi:major facilitator superfamily MFS_1 [Actinobacteria bacterium OK074]|nr:major facilitator superfamily MFS_1 [Actinobacteria bacterium OK074]